MATTEVVRARLTARRTGTRGYRWSTITPVVLLVALFTLFPFAFAAVTSLRQRVLTLPGQTPFVGLRNYSEVIGADLFFTSLKATALFATLTVIPVTALGLAVALLLNQRVRGLGVLRALVLLPWAIPLVSAGIIWRLLLHGNFGALNGVLLQLGVSETYTAWLSDPTWAMLAVAVAHLWREFPLPAILFLAGLQAIPTDIGEAARVDGAGPWARLRHVTLPLLKGPLLIVLVYETMISIAVFDLVFVLTGGGPGSATTLFAWYAYVTTFKFLNLGQGAALSFLMAAGLLGLILIYMKLVGPHEEAV